MDLLSRFDPFEVSRLFLTSYGKSKGLGLFFHDMIAGLNRKVEDFSRMVDELSLVNCSHGI